MKAFSIHFLPMLLIFVSTQTSATDTIMLNTTNARTFASSTEAWSSPNFATDEIYYDQLTCFHSKSNSHDAEMFNWLVVDLGTVIHNLTEVYLSSGQYAESGEVEVFATTYLRTSAHLDHSGSSLMWNAYDECGTTTSDDQSGLSATVRCALPLEGRWLILRRKHPKPLVICLLAAYVTKGEDTCFRTVEPNLTPEAKGNEFRLQRHISLEQCRESCMDTSSCQGLAFTKESRRGRSGDCRLFRGPDGNIDLRNEDADFEDRTQAIRCGKWCHLEQNECNRGQPFPLIRQNNTADSYLSPGTIVWKIEAARLQKINPRMQKIFYAMRFKGRIICDAESCGALHIMLVNDQGEETICTSINTDLISVLDRYTIQCQETSSTKANLGSDTVTIHMIPSNSGDSAPKLEITEGHARFILTEKGRQIQSIAELPIRPEEFFVFPQHTASRGTRPATDIVVEPFTRSQPSWNYKDSAPVFKPNVENRDPDLNIAVEALSGSSRNTSGQVKSPELELPNTISVENRRNFEEVTPRHTTFDGYIDEKLEQNKALEADRFSDYSDKWQNRYESSESASESENRHFGSVEKEEYTSNTVQQEPGEDSDIKNLARASVDWPTYQDSYVSELQNSKEYKEVADYKLESKEFDSSADTKRDLNPFFPSESFSNLKRSDYVSMANNPMQHDAEDSYQGIEPPISRQRQNFTVTSEFNPLSPGDVQVAGSLSVVNLIVLISIASAVILAAVAGIVWFVCIRGH